MKEIATPSQTVGPFFHFGLTPDSRYGTVCGVSDRSPSHWSCGLLTVMDCR